MPQSFSSLHCHIVFSTKHRQALINADWQPRLFEYLAGILRNHGCCLIAAGGMPDHVHLLVSLSRTLAVADVVRQMKSNSSGWVHRELDSPHFQWQEGYGAFAVSYSHLEQVKVYLANQEQHHHRLSFQEEFRELLKRHNLQWDEKHVWE